MIYTKTWFFRGKRARAKIFRAGPPGEKNLFDMLNVYNVYIELLHWNK